MLFDYKPIYLHKKSLVCYEIVRETNVDSPNDKFIPTTVYWNILTGDYYSRPTEEFNEKFVLLKGILRE